MRDASGQMYMRNRYYDPASGQFTQPDPIGLAGGLNSYGFAAGDPVTYSDPYGLNAKQRDSEQSTASESEANDPCDRLRSKAAEAECRRRMAQYRGSSAEQRDAEAYDAFLEHVGSCALAGLEFTARLATDGALVYAYGSGGLLVVRGGILAVEGWAYSSGAIHTATLTQAGRTGAAELFVGGSQVAAGAARATVAAEAAPRALSLLPTNTYTFVRDGGLSACTK